MRLVFSNCARIFIEMISVITLTSLCNNLLCTSTAIMIIMKSDCTVRNKKTRITLNIAVYFNRSLVTTATFSSDQKLRQ